MPLDSTTQVQIAGFNVWDEGKVTTDFKRTGRSTATRQILVTADDEAGFINAMMQTPIVLIGSISNIGQWNQPFAFPQAQNLLIENVVKMEDIPIGGMFNIYFTALDGSQVPLARGKYCRLKLMYASQIYQAFDTGILEFDLAMEAVPIPPGFAIYTYTSGAAAGVDDVSPQFAPTLELPVGTVRFTRKNYPALPTSTWNGLIQGPVNSVPFSLTTAGIAGIQLPAGTCKFESGTSHARMLGGFSSQWDVDWCLKYKSWGWQTALDPDKLASATSVSNAYSPCYLIGSSNPPYSTSDLNVIKQ